MLQEENKNFLPYFFTEPVFNIKEKQDTTFVSEQKTKEPANLKEEPLAPPQTIPYQGKNLKKVLILFNNKAQEGLSQKEQLFLGKILQAVNLNFDDIALVNYGLLEPSLYKQLNHFDALFRISFGVTDEIALMDQQSLSPYEMKQVNGIKLLLVDSLEEIENNRDKKVLLWNNLKTFFVN